VVNRVLGCPIPPASSIVSNEHTIGVGTGHVVLPQGHQYTIIFVHGLGCGINVSPKRYMGKKCTRTVALIGVRGVSGTVASGGHQQVNSFTLIV
tara:strand:+ start:1086 stop:1367 length:282 start_codon:yes stop_codon:yes gene_type:complete